MGALGEEKQKVGELGVLSEGGALGDMTFMFLRQEVGELGVCVSGGRRLGRCVWGFMFSETGRLWDMGFMSPEKEV